MPDVGDHWFRPRNHEMLAIESIEELSKQPVRRLGIQNLDGRGMCQTFLHERHPVAGNRIGMVAWM